MTGGLLRKSTTPRKVHAVIKSMRWSFILVCLLAVSFSPAFAARDKDKKSDTENSDSDKSKDDKDKGEKGRGTEAIRHRTHDHDRRKAGEVQSDGGLHGAEGLRAEAGKEKGW